MKLATKFVHAGVKPDLNTSAIMTPIIPGWVRRYSSISRKTQNNIQ